VENDSELIKNIGKLEDTTEELEEMSLEDYAIDSEEMESILGLVGRVLLSIIK
jgi:hypothetical protein